MSKIDFTELEEAISSYQKTYLCRKEKYAELTTRRYELQRELENIKEQLSDARFTVSKGDTTFHDLELILRRMVHDNE